MVFSTTTTTEPLDICTVFSVRTAPSQLLLLPHSSYRNKNIANYRVFDFHDTKNDSKTPPFCLLDTSSKKWQVATPFFLVPPPYSGISLPKALAMRHPPDKLRTELSLSLRLNINHHKKQPSATAPRYLLAAPAGLHRRLPTWPQRSVLWRLHGGNVWKVYADFM